MKERPFKDLPRCKRSVERKPSQGFVERRNLERERRELLARSSREHLDGDPQDTKAPCNPRRSFKGLGRSFQGGRESLEDPWKNIMPPGNQPAKSLGSTCQGERQNLEGSGQKCQSPVREIALGMEARETSNGTHLAR